VCSLAVGSTLVAETADTPPVTVAVCSTPVPAQVAVSPGAPAVFAMVVRTRRVAAPRAPRWR
jgi:hypothetical protein